MSPTTGMVGWDGIHRVGHRPCGIHPLASIGGPPESRTWKVGHPYREPIIHPTALIHAFVTVDAGQERATRIGARTFIMAHSHVGHDTVIGDDCELATHVIIAGHVEIGNNVRIGGGASLKPRVKVGDGAVIGTGAIVTKDVPAGETWVGNPARRLVKPEDQIGYGCGNASTITFTPNEKNATPVNPRLSGASYDGRTFWETPRREVTARFPTEQEIAKHLYGKGAVA